MFLENINTGRKRGWIEVICGSMFSGKTEELIRRLRRAEFAKQKIAIYKPDLDKRYHAIKIVSHQGSEITSIPVKTSAEILESGVSADVIGIAFPDGSVHGDKANVKFRFTGEYMDAAAKGAL